MVSRQTSWLVPARSDSQTCCSATSSRACAICCVRCPVCTLACTTGDRTCSSLYRRACIIRRISFVRLLVCTVVCCAACTAAVEKRVLWMVQSCLCTGICILATTGNHHHVTPPPSGKSGCDRSRAPALGGCVHFFRRTHPCCATVSAASHLQFDIALISTAIVAFGTCIGTASPSKYSSNLQHFVAFCSTC